MSHTRGPLFVEYRNDVPYRKWAVYVFIDGNGPEWTVATFDKREDAFLFASAPDMVTELQNVEKILNHNGLKSYCGPILSVLAKASGNR